MRRQGRDSLSPRLIRPPGPRRLGDACLLAFSYAQSGGLNWALIAGGAAPQFRGAANHRYVQTVWQGYQRGKAANWLASEDYGPLMSEPLDAARRRLNITPATLCDPIPVADRDGVIPKG